MRPIRLGRKLRQDERAHHALVGQLRAVLHPCTFQVEYRFALQLNREYQWDIAFPARMLAVEVDGGIWVKGAHSHPVTILRNMEKRNLGALLGWRVLAFSTDQAKSGYALAYIELALKTTTGNEWQHPRGEIHAEQVPVTRTARSRRATDLQHLLRAQTKVARAPGRRRAVGGHRGVGRVPG